MSYTRNPTWHDFPATDTPITAAALENIENGIVAAAATADSASSGLASKVDTGDSRLSDARTPLAHTHAESEITGLVADLAAKALNTVTVSAGTGLTGGGDLTANRTLSVDFAGAGVTTAGKVVNANDARLSDARTPTAHNHAGSEITSGTVAYARLPVGTTASTVAAGDDSRFGKIGGTVTVTGTPTAGQVPVATTGTTATWQTPSGGGGAAFIQGGGRRYTTFTVGTGSSQVTMTAASLRVTPVLFGRASTLSSVIVGVDIAGSAGATGRMGIYSDSNGYPGALLADFGTFAADTNGNKSITVSQAVSAGQYWFGVVCYTATTMPTLRGQWHLMTYPIDPTVDFGGNRGGVLVQNGVTGALPATFSTTLTALGNTPPIIFGFELS